MIRKQAPKSLRVFGRGGRIRADDLRVMSLRFQYRDVSPFSPANPLSQLEADFAISFHRLVRDVLSGFPRFAKIGVFDYLDANEPIPIEP